MAKAKKKCVAPPKTKKFNGKNYKRSAGTIKLKTKAKKSAEAHRKKGGKARVIKNPCGAGYYLYKAG